MTPEATYDLRFELSNLDNLRAHTSLACLPEMIETDARKYYT